MSSESSVKRRPNAKASATAAAAPPSDSDTPKSGPRNKPKQKQPPSQQQRMLMQMRAQQELENEQGQVVQAYAGGAFSDQLWKLVRTFLLLLLVGGGLLYLYAPSLVGKLLRRKPQLPPRSIISVYPDHVHVKRDLPRFFHEYSLATPQNAAARAAVRHVANDLRPMATNAGSKYQQRISLWPWEVRTFRSQLPTAESLDQYCGKGTNVLFETRPDLHEEIVLWCLLATAHDHGFLRYNVQHVYGSIARGIQGVAVRYDGHANRAMAQSLLLLPFHKPEDLSKGKPLPPSTKVPMRTFGWMRQNAALIADPAEFLVALEEFLFWIIAKEEASWYWLYAACTAEERQARAGDPRVASMCTAEQEAAADADCCVIFDPHLHEFFGRAKGTRARRGGKR